MTHDLNLTRRNVLRAGVALGGVFLLSRCGADGETGTPAPTGAPTATAGPTEAVTLDDLVAASEAEGGELLWYLPGQAETAEALQQGFTAAYPWTSPEVQSLTFRDMPNKIVTEAITEAPTCDVFMLPPAFRQMMLDNDVPTPASIPSESEIPEGYTDPAGYAHPCYLLLITTIYNTNSLPDGPPPPEDMDDPEWAGMMSFDRVQGLGQSTLWLSSWREQWGDADWVRWLQGLKDNEVFITSSGGDTYAAVLRGERAFGIGSSNDINAQEPGTPMAADYSYPPVPFVQNLWLTKRAANPATGALFINWVLSEEGQLALASTGRSPANTDLDTPVSIHNFLPDGVEPLDGADLRDYYDRTANYLSILDSYWPG